MPSYSTYDRTPGPAALVVLMPIFWIFVFIVWLLWPSNAHAFMGTGGNVVFDTEDLGDCEVFGTSPVAGAEGAKEMMLACDGKLYHFTLIDETTFLEPVGYMPLDNGGELLELVPTDEEIVDLSPTAEEED